ncbi:hypothetical protein MKY95_10125 [Paenibacillus sp. FSL P4-0176]|uniref:hypothetical protein n=1 Tax=Paenibacillus sp. FSL P4-0176 TaxID=2921631 RepID=UPI0030D2DB40
MKDYSNYHNSFKQKVKHDANKILSYSINHSLEAEEVTVNGRRLKVTMNDKTSSTDLMKYIIGEDSSLKLGDIVELDNGQKWLIVTYNVENVLYKKWEAKYCNLYLKWIDDNGDIQSHPTVFYFNAKSNFGVEEGKVMNLPAGRRQTIVQLNEHTRKIKRDDRFIFGGEVFKVIDNDYVSDEGLVNLSLQSDQEDTSKDNFELGIADYNRYTPYSMKLLNNDINSIGINQTIQLNVEVRKGNNLISNPSLEFIVINNEIGDIDSTGLFTPKQVGETEITINYKGLSENIRVLVVDSIRNEYSATVSGNDSIKSGKEGTYACEFQMNGSPWQDEGLFVLTSDDGISPSKYVSITSQGNNKCTIKAASNIDFTKIKVPLYVQLHVQNLNRLSVGYKRIKIIPLM